MRGRAWAACAFSVQIPRNCYVKGFLTGTLSKLKRSYRYAGLENVAPLKQDY